MERTDILDAGVARTGGEVVVTLTGELDHASAPRLQALIDGAVDAQVSSVTIVCDQLRFIDSAGLRLLLNTYQLVADRGGTLRVVHPVEQVARGLEVTGLDEVLIVVHADPI